MNILSQLGLGYLIFSGLLTLFLFIFNWVGTSITLTTLTFSILLSFFILFIIRRAQPNMKRSKHTAPWHKRDYWLLAIIVAMLAIVVINGLWNVVSVWDALTLYDFRALRIVETGSIAQAAMIQGDYFYSYPLYTSLAHTSLYLLGFKSPMIFYAVLFVSFIAVFYALMRRTLPRHLSLLASILLILAPHIFWHAQIAYTNLPYTIYLGLGAIYILEYTREGSRSDAMLGALMTGLSIWTRSVEPFWMINIAVLTLATLYHRKYLDTALSLLIFIPLERVWKIYVASARNSLVENPIGQVINAVVTVVNTPPVTVTRVPLVEVISYFFANAVRPFLPVLSLFIISLAYKLFVRSRYYVGEVMIIGYYCIAFYGTHVYSYSQPYWRDIPGSLERMMMFISPIIIYIFARVFSQIMSTNLPHIKYNKKIL